MLVLGLSASLVSAGEPGPGQAVQAPEQVNDNVQSYFPVQGRLTDAAGTPLNGDYSITFRLYDVYSGGIALCSDTNPVKVTKGLFNSEVWGTCSTSIQGKQLFLSIEVESSGELDPRQPIFAVPYAWSLRPGASIIGSIGSGAILHIENNDPTGRGLRTYATSTTGINYGIVAASESLNGYGAFIYNNGGGTALKVAGTGKIQSTANSYVWISGNGVRPYHQADTTIIDMDSVGGAKITRGQPPGCAM